MKIRTLKLSDIEQASEIVGLNYSKKYKKTSFIEMEAMFKNYTVKPQYVVAEDEGKIIGLAGYIQSRMDYDIYNIFWVNVTPEKQGCGVGSKLMEKVINNIKKEKCSMILLTTSKPKIYSKKFNFTTLSKFGKNKYDLMCLKLK